MLCHNFYKYGSQFHFSYATVPVVDAQYEERTMNVTIQFNNADIGDVIMYDAFTYKANPGITNINPTKLLDV